ncbi:hypothetical protein JQX13_00220 [Archangium violaceum]|uniref:JmjC domain-containing protein n=1 Tax=Archangium violaceum TaxID=83451 RepID=UPI00193C5956|nr:cupin domain-containing protein [Archangium violaceum]QRK08656.1 hypothetical protein JQX13_00220 [Archangium violaceum]
MLVPAPASAPRDAARGEPSLALPRSFWKDFSQNHWERGPVLLRGLFPAHFPTTEEIFDAFVWTSERWFRGEFPPNRVLRFFIEHLDGPEGIPYYSMMFPTRNQLPVREDGDMEGYLARVDKWLGGKRFGLTLNRCHTQHWGHWQQITSFLSGLYEVLGVPLFGSDSAIFLGNYRYTPFGIHKDDLHVFSFVIEGKKTLSFWPFDSLAQREEVPRDPQLIDKPGCVIVRDQADEEKLLSQATLLHGEPGDLMYWPASYWHRAEPSTSPLTITASLGVSYHSPELLGTLPPPQWPGRLRANEMPVNVKRGWQVPASVRSVIKAQSRRDAVRAAERERTAEWVRHLTGAAMDGAPPEATEPPLSPQEWIRTHPKRPLVGVPLPGGHLLISGMGRSTTLEPSPAVRRRIERLLETLNTGKPQQVEALEEAFFSRMPARSFKRDAFRALLDDLVRWRAVWRCAQSRAK